MKKVINRLRIFVALVLIVIFTVGFRIIGLFAPDGMTVCSAPNQQGCVVVNPHNPTSFPNRRELIIPVTEKDADEKVEPPVKDLPVFLSALFCLFPTSFVLPVKEQARREALALIKPSPPLFKRNCTYLI